MSTINERPTRLFMALAGLFVTNALIAEFVGGKSFALEPTLGVLKRCNIVIGNDSGVGHIAIAVGVTLGVLLAFQVIVATPAVVIPVGGMVVSGAMAASAVTLRRIQGSARDQRERVEARLSLGLTAVEAFAPEQRDAVRTALIPAIDTTKVVGLISLPGAMTGLILAGVDPLDAIREQLRAEEDDCEGNEQEDDRLHGQRLRTATTMVVTATTGVERPSDSNRIDESAIASTSVSPETKASA